MNDAENTDIADSVKAAAGPGTVESTESTDRAELSGSTAIAEGAGTLRPRRSIGTVGAGLLVLLGVAMLAVAVIPQPRWDLWLVGVVAVLGLSLVLLILALLPRGRGREIIGYR